VRLTVLLFSPIEWFEILESYAENAVIALNPVVAKVG